MGNAEEIEGLENPSVIGDHTIEAGLAVPGDGNAIVEAGSCVELGRENLPALIVVHRPEVVGFEAGHHGVVFRVNIVSAAVHIHIAALYGNNDAAGPVGDAAELDSVDLAHQFAVAELVELGNVIVDGRENHIPVHVDQPREAAYLHLCVAVDELLSIVV